VFTALLIPFAALAFGLIPALRSTRLDIASVLKTVPGDSARGRRFTLRNTLVVLQVAISVALLAAAGLFIRSAHNAALIDIGFKPDGILIAAIDPRTHGYSAEKTVQFTSQLRDKVAAIPGVRSVSFTDLVPLSFAGTNYDFSTDREGTAPEQKVDANVFTVSDGFFQTMGMQIRQGRDFHRQGDATAAIVNEHVAAQLFPRQDPIGRQIHQGKSKYTIIGVVANSKARFISDAPDNTIYLQLGSVPSASASFFGMSILVKSAGDPHKFERPLRDVIASLDPNMAVFNVETMEDHVSKSLLLPRISSVLLGLFGAIGLGLAAIGLFAVMSYWVRRRVHEIGIRMALGARRGELLKMVLGQALAMTAVGLAIGISLALLLGRSMASLLYGVKGADLATCCTVSAVLLATAILATIVPALKAANVEPSTALRHE
jgi:predicted permease